MLKKIRECDIDSVMSLWKVEAKKAYSFLKNDKILNNYINVRNKILENKETSTVYTEGDELKGFINVDKDGRIWSMAVREDVQREGIGTILIKKYQKDFDKLSVNALKKDKSTVMFLLKNGFKVVSQSSENIANEMEYYLEWERAEKKKLTFVYFDNDIEEKLVEKNDQIDFKNINIKRIIKKEELAKIEPIEKIDDIKTYVKIRKKIEEAFVGEKIFLYINYNNYYSFLTDLVIDIAKIKKTNLTVVICEPQPIEGTKIKAKVVQIEKDYQGTNIYKFNYDSEEYKDTKVTDFFYKRNEALLTKLLQMA